MLGADPRDRDPRDGPSGNGIDECICLCPSHNNYQTGDYVELAGAHQTACDEIAGHLSQPPFQRAWKRARNSQPAWPRSENCGRIIVKPAETELDMYEQIPLEVLKRYQGKWIIWDQDDKKVVGCGESLDEAEDQAAGAPSDHLLRVHHALPSDWEIAGVL
jgi:hypothetical protein